MGGSKTRIWRGGLSEIMGNPAAEQALRAASQLPPAAALGAVREDAASESASAVAPARAATLVSVQASSKTLIGHVLDMDVLREQLQAERGGARPMSSTRLVPIESLLAGANAENGRPMEATTCSGGDVAVADHEASEQALLRKLAATPRRITGTHVRRALIVVCAISAALLHFAGGHGNAAAPRRPAETLAQGEVAAPRPASSATRDGHTRAVTPAGAPPFVGYQPRHAVDALASGDLARAQLIYAELARTVEGRSAYSEASRILAQRLHEKRY